MFESSEYADIRDVNSSFPAWVLLPGRVRPHRRKTRRLHPSMGPEAARPAMVVLASCRDAQSCYRTRPARRHMPVTTWSLWSRSFWTDTG